MTWHCNSSKGLNDGGDNRCGWTAVSLRTCQEGAAYYHALRRLVDYKVFGAVITCHDELDDDMMVGAV